MFLIKTIADASKYTVWRVIFFNRQCQKDPLSITDMFVLDHKKVSLINHKIDCD